MRRSFSPLEAPYSLSILRLLLYRYLYCRYETGASYYCCSINSSNYTALMTSTKVYFSSTRLLQYNVYRSNISRIIFPELNRLTSVFDKPRTKPISRNAGHSEDFKTNIDNFLYFHVTIL